ncbi:MAG: NAD(+) diphosphatase, partial [SAR324 cluster bacterium]|nr:NAD(+) diphosphatase [SAR324 cluster bacterium]
APNHFSFGGLDRDVISREESNCLDFVLERPETRIVPVWRSLNLFSGALETGKTPVPAYLSTEEATDLIKIAKNQVYLGKQNVANTLISYLAIDISSLEEDEATNKLAPWGKFADLREIGPLIGGIEGSILAYARGIIFWHSRNGYCGVCGKATIATKGGHQRNCTKKGCACLHFPRTDPAVIMLVKDGDRVLLGRQKIWPEGLYSTLAGFVELGETIEHAVAREVYEESGIIVKDIIYQHSQPWPFPSSLMLGFTAEACTKKINLNDAELEDAQWFTRSEMLNFEEQEKFLPRKVSVSRRLIDDWLYKN